MNGFFTDNQTKQKAYDRFYNAMAKSDFVQGAKLQAKLREQGLDDASTDSLAKLFQQVIGQARDYDYDKLLKKTKIAPPPIIEGKKEKPFTYVPHQTDTGYNASEYDSDVNMSGYDEQDFPPAYENIFREPTFNEKMRNALRNPFSLDEEQQKEAIHKKVFDYLNGKSKTERQKMFNLKRTTDDININKAADEITKMVLKRKRKEQMPNEPSPNPQPKSRRRRGSTMSNLDLNERKSDKKNEDVKNEGVKNEPTNADNFDWKGYNERMVNSFNTKVDNFAPVSGQSLLAKLTPDFRDFIDNKMGPNYFNDNVPKMKGRGTRAKMETYKQDLKDWLRDVLIAAGDGPRPTAEERILRRAQTPTVAPAAAPKTNKKKQ